MAKENDIINTNTNDTETDSTSKLKILSKAIPLLLDWYESNHRDLPWRKDKNPYHVWLSEIMLQQTRVEAVKGYYARFLSTLPDIKALSEVDEEQLLKLWEGLGYYNRARNLKKAAMTIMEEFNGTFPSSYTDIRNLAGIGDYTAGAIGSICFELQTPAVDGNVLRIYTRLLEDASNIDKQQTKKAVANELEKVYVTGKCSLTTQALMELGACVCVPNGSPHCNECPWNHICLAKKHNTISNYPVREEKKKRKIVNKTVFVFSCDNKIAIHKRPSKGLLPNLWEFPNIDKSLTEQEAADFATSLLVSPEQLLMKTNYTHVFSHVEWHMTAYYFTCHDMVPESKILDEINPSIIWCTKNELESIYAIPSAFKPFLQNVLEE